MFENLYVSDLIFYNENVESIIKFLKDNKVEKVEFFIEPLDEEYTKKMCEVLNNYKFKSISFHGPFRRCRLTDMTEKGWNDVIYSYVESFKMAKEFNASLMVLHSNERLSGPVDKVIIEKRIKEIVNLGKEYGVEVLVENVGIKENMIFDQDSYESLILDNNYSSLIDIGHAFLNNWDIEGLINRLKNNIKAFHFHNNDGSSDQHKAISNGKINYNHITEIYRKYTPNANIVLEYDFTESQEILLKDLENLKKL